MDRRKFMLGIGGGALGGSALLGSGAFSRIESQRTMDIKVAHDEDAYLGLVRKDPDEYPNASYVDYDDKGHIRFRFNPENETDAGGQGVNSNSMTFFDHLFKIRNQGKQSVTVCMDTSDLEFDFEESEADGAAVNPEDVVIFYKHDPHAKGSNGLEGIQPFACPNVDFNAGSYCWADLPEPHTHRLPVGEELQIGLLVCTKDSSLHHSSRISGEVRILADASKEADQGHICDIWGIDQTDDEPQLRPITTGAPDPSVETGVGLVDTTREGASVSENYPNGLAHDGTETLWYFADDDGVLWTYDATADEFTEYDEIIPGTQVAGAAYHDKEFDRGDGPYYFVEQGGSELKTADVEVGTVDDVPEVTTVTDIDDVSGIGLGDLAIDRDADQVYISMVSSNDEGRFVRINLDDPSDQEVLVSGVSNAPSSATSAGKQIAFGLDENGEKQLYAHEAAGEDAQGEWYQVDTDTGGVIAVGTTSTFTDLAQCGPIREL